MPFQTSVVLASVVCLAAAGAARPDDDVAAILKNQDRRKAWDRLVARGPAALPELLAAMDTRDTAAANWLRTAFDRIVEKERAAGGKNFDAEALLRFVQDPKQAGRARRLALELVEELRPGTTAKLVPGWIEDSEFRYEAVEALIKEADVLEKARNRADAAVAFQRAFEASRDLQQAKIIAVRLRDLDVTVSVAEHFGFLMHWEVIGPFDGLEMKGFRTAYPPEKDPDVKEAIGKGGNMLTWKAVHVKEPPPSAGGHVALVNLLEPLGQIFDAVGYARTKFEIDKAGEYEFRGAADDNMTVWVNGEKVFAYEEYRNGVRFDRHKFKVNLKAGVNTILVKICQAPIDPTNPEPNWEFFLRLVDAEGKGVAAKVVPDK
jgi:hypothetical protein